MPDNIDINTSTTATTIPVATLDVGGIQHEKVIVEHLVGGLPVMTSAADRIDELAVGLEPARRQSQATLVERPCAVDVSHGQHGGDRSSGQHTQSFRLIRPRWRRLAPARPPGRRISIGFPVRRRQWPSSGDVGMARTTMPTHDAALRIPEPHAPVRALHGRRPRLRRAAACDLGALHRRLAP